MLKKSCIGPNPPGRWVSTRTSPRGKGRLGDTPSLRPLPFRDMLELGQRARLPAQLGELSSQASCVFFICSFFSLR